MENEKNVYGIKEDQTYLIVFLDKCNKRHHIRGKIIDFNEPQFTINTNDGLYIIEKINIEELRPIAPINKVYIEWKKERTKLSEEKDQEEFDFIFK